ncbi:MAG: prephenate dehydratase [Actinomycetota bacterium]|nr:prephenate dehydratase [Actinomycetota bacterium]
MPETPAAAPRRLAYLGPEGTFTEAALLRTEGAAGADRVACPTVSAAVEAVRSGAADGAVVPLENSVEGSVATTLDELASGEPLQVMAEVLLPVEFALLARPGTPLTAVRRIGTHPHAHAQCRGWLRAHLPQADVLPATSTAGAAQVVAARDDLYDAAIAAPLAGERYGLAPLASGIGDNSGAVTRFVLVTRPGLPPAVTGADKTTLVLFERDDHPGALLEMLTEFAVRGVNLTRLESRPTGGGLGRYCFSVDCEGHVAEARVGEALSALHRICAEVRYLGSYPRADEVPPTVRAGTRDSDFAAADEWLRGLRGA